MNKNLKPIKTSILGLLAPLIIAIILSFTYTGFLMLIPISLWLYFAFVVTSIGIAILILNKNRPSHWKYAGWSLTIIPFLYQIISFLLEAAGLGTKIAF